MRGIFGPEGAPWLTVEVLGPDDRRTEVEAVVDTGFNGHLTLPSAVATSLSLPVVGEARSTMADGREVVEDVCVARVIMHGTPRPARVSISETVPLLGTALLSQNRLRIDLVAGGEVLIEEIE